MNNLECKSGNRWLIAIMGTVLQLFLGTVYAWSYFQKPLVSTYGWTNSQVAWAFSLAIFFLGLAAAWGGINLPKFGPRKLAVSGGFLFGLGYLLGAIALKIHFLPLLHIGYGVVGGIGLGLGYVTPVATAAKWFPDKKGFITGMVIMGFGLGALLMSKFFAPMLITQTNGNMVFVFAILGVLFMILTMIAGSFLKNPPAGYIVPGFSASGVAANSTAAQTKAEEQSGTFAEYVFSSRFFYMWIIFFCNITAGISIIGFQSPLMQDLLKAVKPETDVAALAAAGALLIGISSLFNGVGRFFWGGLSDKIGRVQAFRIMLITQIIAFILLMFIKSPFIFGVVVCYILLCYGGGFGTMPSFVTTVFGSKMMPVVYGAILTAWSCAGIVGPQILAIIKDKMGAQASFYAFAVSASFLFLGVIFAFIISNKPFELKK